MTPAVPSRWPLLASRQLTLSRPLVCIDLETTGHDARRDHIVEFGAVKQFPDGRIEELTFRIKPSVPISNEAFGVHGISDTDLRDAPAFAEVAPSIVGLLAGCDVVGHGARDTYLPFLRAELSRAGTPHLLDTARIVDTMRIFRKCVPQGKVDNHRLGTAYRYYFHKALQGEHSALADARAALDVLKAQVATHASLSSNVSGLHAMGLT